MWNLWDFSDSLMQGSLQTLAEIIPFYEEQQKGKVKLNFHLELLSSGLLKLYLLSGASYPLVAPTDLNAYSTLVLWVHVNLLMCTVSLVDWDLKSKCSHTCLTGIFVPLNPN